MSHQLVVLISGSGTNLQAIMDACDRGDIDGSIVLVLSNKADAYGLVRAQNAGIDTAVVSHTDHASRETFDQAMIDVITPYQPNTIVLAGFMRILSPVFANQYEGKILNIHPSLLPKYKGLHTHKRALEAGDSHHGCSIHFVTPELDGGPIIAEAPFPVTQDDTEESLTEKVHLREHKLYPLVVGWRAAGRLYLNGKTVMLDNQPLPFQGYELTE